MFFPYRVDVAMARVPWMNWLLIAVTVVVSVALFGPLDQWSGAGSPPDGVLRYFVLYPGYFHAAQLVGNLFTHAGWWHLLGNMWFLWVFGNAINAKVGQLQYLALYLGIGVLESLVWLAIGPKMPAIGASGAIMGIVGAFLIMYPQNDVSCVFTLGWFIRPFQFSSGWLIALYAAFDVWGLVGADRSPVAYLAHVTGFAAGAGLMALLLFKGVLEADRCERSLLQVFGWMPESEETGGVGAGWKGGAMGAGKERGGLAAVAAVRKAMPSRARDNSPIPLE